jgi:hypothetical protein
MSGDFHPASVRGVGTAIVDVMFALSVLAILATSLLTMLNDDSRDQLARAYARQFRVATEDDCPRTLGKPFWFACASEARRLNPAPPPAPAK